MCQSLSCVRIFVTSWTVAPQAPLSMEVRILEWVALPFSRGICPTQESKLSLMHYRWILYCLSHQGSPNHILLTFKAHSFLLISTNKQEFCIFRMARRESAFLLHVRHDRHFPSILSARLSRAWVVFSSPGRQPSKRAMCACEMPLCIFRKFLRGRQPKYFYCTAGTVSCWSVGKKKKGNEREEKI